MSCRRAAPVVSGAISAAMMTLSIGASWLAPGLRKALGLGGVLLFAVAIQVGLVGVMMTGEGLVVIAFLMLRMAPNAIAQPFVIAAIQPELSDDSRATFISVRNLIARLAFAATLAALSVKASATAEMSSAEISAVLQYYFVGGVVILAALAVTVRALGRR